MHRAVILLGLLACSSSRSAVDAGLSCSVGAVRECACGPSGLDGLGVERCVADGFASVWVCDCDAGARLDAGARPG